MYRTYMCVVPMQGTYVIDGIDRGSVGMEFKIITIM